MQMIPVKLQLDPGALTPTRAHTTDTGYDIHCLTSHTEVLIEDTWQTLPIFLADKQWRIVIDTGVHLQPPPGWAFSLRPNSRNGKSRFRWSFSPGTIDQGYTGSIKIILEPRTHHTKPAHAPQPGQVCGQLILERVYEADFRLVSSLTTTDRGPNGFGSTERKELQ